ncbi:hypothetical protein C8Q80DRAFT_1178384 [Daedaleopsis nitida]|nr:hypothetical protein C8Q80DRAFT_1178384 [Daedaleopsis nitida]
MNVHTGSWDSEDREKEIGNYVLNSMSPSAGAMLGLTLSNNGIDWRSTCWILSIIAGLCTALVVGTFRETHLKSTTVQPRPSEAATANENGHNDETDTTNQSSPSNVRCTGNKSLQTIAKPYVLLGRSPILIASSIYLALVGTLLSTFFKVAAVGLLGYPPIIQMFVSSAVLLGCTIGLILHNVLIYPRYYLPRVHRFGPDLAPPELRLSLAICAAPLLPCSLLLFGWTLSPHICVAVPLLACLTLGLSVQWIMQAMVNYVIDIFQDVVASALSWHTVLTYTFVTAFSVYSDHILRTLSTQLMSTLMACVAVAVVPVPILLTRYGPALRAKSRRLLESE